MNPSWVMVGIALGGMIFQAGIGWSYFSRFKALEEKVDDHTLKIPETNARIDQHEWRLTNHDQRLHTHDLEIEKMRSNKA